MKTTIPSLIAASCLSLSAALPHASAETPRVKAGETTTGAPGTPAKVTSMKKGNAVLFNFVIPQGAVGPEGPQGPAAPALSKARTIYIPGAAMSFSGTSGITPGQWGPTLTASAGATPGFVVPRPADWDNTLPFSITLIFSAPSNSTTSTNVLWRLRAGGSQMNTTSNNASTGWDSYDFWAVEDAAPLIIPVSASGYFDLAKSQTWTAKFSSTYNTWYFGNPGTGVTVANSFTDTPLWHFTFQRGTAAGNGESYSSGLSINAAVVSYTAK